MAFVDFKPTRTETECAGLFQNLTVLHLRGNKYRNLSVLPSLLALTPSLARLSIQVKAGPGRSGPAVLSEEVVSDLLGSSHSPLQRLEEIRLGVLQPHHGGPQVRVEASHWFRSVETLCSDWLRPWCCYARNAPSNISDCNKMSGS